ARPAASSRRTASTWAPTTRGSSGPCPLAIRASSSGCTAPWGTCTPRGGHTAHGPLIDMGEPHLTLVRLEPGGDRACALLPAVLRRVANFCSTFPTSLNGEEQAGRIRAYWLAGSPWLGLWAAVDGLDDVRGHLFAEYIAARHTVFVMQLQIDKPLML